MATINSNVKKVRRTRNKRKSSNESKVSKDEMNNKCGIMRYNDYLSNKK
jgi:hypothetical protein